jgi:pimeloyl-ACP methyl ester carboxylesterase
MLTKTVALVLGVCAARLGAQATIARGPSPSGSFSLRRESVEWTDSVTTRAIIWTPISTKRDLPGIIFSPGFGQAPANYSVMLAELASHGYVVVGVEHPHFKDPDTIELYDVAPVLARQLVSTLDHIVTDRGHPGSPFARLDPKRIGVLGHSIGGGAAALACSMDERLKAGMDLDGTIFGSVVHTGMKQPFLLVRKHIILSDSIIDPPRFLEQHDQASLHEDSVFAHTPTMYWLSVDHLDHMSFTDAALTADSKQRVQEMAGLRLSAARTQEITSRFARDFFATYLSGVPRAVSLDKTPYGETQLKRKR